MNFIAIIPARLASTRLPAKPLVDIAGKPMVVRVMERAKASGAVRVIVATDHQSIVNVVTQHGGEACLTRLDHQSGTERLAEVIEHFSFDDQQVIVNVQGDEPLIPPIIIQKVAENLVQHGTDVATLAAPLTHIEDVFNPNVVKVVTDKRGYALYFSRSPIPWDRIAFAQSPPTMAADFLRHIGIYAYRAGFIRRYVHWQPSPLEHIELLEQLRVLWHGENIHVGILPEAPGAGVDTPEDLARVLTHIEHHGEKA